MHSLILIFSILVFLTNTWSQPLASPKALGMDQQYFIKTSASFKSFFGEYSSSNKITLNQDEVNNADSKNLSGVVTLPGVSNAPSVRLGVGSRIRQHLFSMEYGFAPLEGSFHELNVEYQYLMGFPKRIKPSFIFGLDFHQFFTDQNTQLSSNAVKKHDTKFWGKGFHIGPGIHMSNKRFGWENRLLIRGLSLDNISANDETFRIQGLLMSWSLDVETALYLYF